MAEFELPKELSEFLALDSGNLEDFKADFEKKYVGIDKLADRKDLINPLFGKKIGEIETKVRSAARSFGIDLKDDGIPKDTKIDGVIDIVFGKVGELRDTQVKEFKDKVGDNDDEALGKLQGEFDTFKESQGKKYSDLEILKTDAVDKFNDLEKTTGEQFTQIKLDTLRGEANNKITWASEEKDFALKKKGFDFEMKENFKTTLNDEGSFIVTNSKGERIKDEKVTGEFKSYDTVLSEEAAKAGLIKVNPQGGKPAPNFTPPTSSGAPPPVQTTRKINTATR